MMKYLMATDRELLAEIDREKSKFGHTDWPHVWMMEAELERRKSLSITLVEKNNHECN